MAGTLRPKPSDRMKEGLRRLKNNTDFDVFKKHLEAELAYYKDQLVLETGDQSFAQLQGRARQLQDQLKYINEE